MTSRPSRWERSSWYPAAMTLMLAWPAVLAGQARARLPLAFAQLEGRWEGSGVLLSRPAAFQMRWTVADRGFVLLEFSNSWVGNDGSITPVLTSHAIYYVRDSSAVGVWLDSRPQRIELQATFTDTSVVTNWTAAAEAGRTEYIVRSRDTVIVRDFVSSNGSERLFAEATYRRASGPP